VCVCEGPLRATSSHSITVHYANARHERPVENFVVDLLAHGGTRISADQDVSFDAQASMLASLCQTLALPAHDKWAAATFLADLLDLTAQPAKRTPHKAAAVRPLPRAASDNHSFAVPPENLIARGTGRLAVQEG
jgi:hypothetical protein